MPPRAAPPPRQKPLSGRPGHVSVFPSGKPTLLKQQLEVPSPCFYPAASPSLYSQLSVCAAAVFQAHSVQMLLIWMTPIVTASAPLGCHQRLLETRQPISRLGPGTSANRCCPWPGVAAEATNQSHPPPLPVPPDQWDVYSVQMGIQTGEGELSSGSEMRYMYSFNCKTGIVCNASNNSPFLKCVLLTVEKNQQNI